MEDSREREKGLVEVVASHITSNLFDWRFCREKGLNIRGILFHFIYFLFFAYLSVGC